MPSISHNCTPIQTTSLVAKKFKDALSPKTKKIGCLVSKLRGKYEEFSAKSFNDVFEEVEKFSNNSVKLEDNFIVEKSVLVKKHLDVKKELKDKLSCSVKVKCILQLTGRHLRKP